MVLVLFIVANSMSGCINNQYILALTTDQNIYGCYRKDKEVLIDSINKQNFSLNNTFVLQDAFYIAGMAADQESNVYILDI